MTKNREQSFGKVDETKTPPNKKEGLADKNDGTTAHVIWGYLPRTVEKILAAVMFGCPFVMGVVLFRFCNRTSGYDIGFVLIITLAISLVVNRVLMRIFVRRRANERISDGDVPKKLFLYSIFEMLIELLILFLAILCFCAATNKNVQETPFSDHEPRTIYDQLKRYLTMDTYCFNWLWYLHAIDAWATNGYDSCETEGQSTSQVTPISRRALLPRRGTVCRLYDYMPEPKTELSLERGKSDLSELVPVAIFSDCDDVFAPSGIRKDVRATCGVWDGIWEEDVAREYLFLCKPINDDDARYEIWINGKKMVDRASGQLSFWVQLQKGMNSAVIVCCSTNDQAALSIFRKKSVSLNDPLPFSPRNMFHMDWEPLLNFVDSLYELPLSNYSSWPLRLRHGSVDHVLGELSIGCYERMFGNSETAAPSNVSENDAGDDCP